MGVARVGTATFGGKGAFFAAFADAILAWPLFRSSRFHRPAWETEFCGQRLAGEFSRRARENGQNSVRRPGYASLTGGDCGHFSHPGNPVGLPGLRGGAEGIRTSDLRGTGTRAVTVPTLPVPRDLVPKLSLSIRP
jgi:hypothetical protein